MTRHRSAWILGLVTLACGGGGDPAEGPPPLRTGIAVLEDLDPDPRVVEVSLVAEHQHEWDLGQELVHGAAYNGSNPGPLLEANLGDRIVVRFENRLLWPTTVHWHGLRVPEVMDGTERSQTPLQPGESFTYEFEAREAGLFWYHPHMHEGVQIDLGLYGPILIHGPGEPALATDQPLMFDDVRLDETGQIAGLDPHGDMPHDGLDEDGDGQPDERYGNVLLANGKRAFTAPVQAGTWSLFRMVNVANSRTMNIHLEGHTMIVVGTDGSWLAQPFETESVRLGVGERAQVLIEMTGTPGETYPFVYSWGGEDPFAENPISEATPIAAVRYVDRPAVVEEMPIFPADDSPDLADTGRVEHTWEIREIFTPDGPVIAIDGEVWPEVTVRSWPAGGDYTFVVLNNDNVGHPWHIHGNRFQVTAVDDRPVDWRGWKDTVFVPARSKVTLRTSLDNPGTWMVHCHILVHMMEGMMTEIRAASP